MGGEADVGADCDEVKAGLPSTPPPPPLGTSKDM